MASIAVAWVEINAYVASIGPDVGRPKRPQLCPSCDARRIWFDGWRVVYAIVLCDGSVHRFENGLPLQRVVCAECAISWTLRPAFLYPHRTFALDVVEAAVFAYLSAAAATYKRVAERFCCSARSVWRWVGWAAGRANAAEIVAETERARATGETAALIPREVPADHDKAYSLERAALLLASFQTLCAIGVSVRARPIAPSDPSALRCYLNERLRTLAEVHLLTAAAVSPRLPVALLGSRRVQRPP